ncbi:hypothetical protein [Bacillus suaedaesalsae]|uniref:Uncharacterized protein n=1 Tax=Bacillus suaedaesalsae TaxID=2810349 RepID=A0ABS2DFF5_9BACI|nr:hypothetical protein [Bacillus suaedaesalsae]MBM6616286.1 hypothetical protein [Bacillus suaedaesalsae]
MKRFLKILLFIIGFVLLAIGILVLIFIQEMKPDKDEEEKVKQLAATYVESNFQDHIIIYDALYDNMGNFPYFEYAAMARHSRDGTEFLVFYNEETEQTEDSYIADKWENELENEIRPYLQGKLGQLDELWIFYDDRIGFEYSVDQNKPDSYKNKDASASINIFIPRKREKGDEELFNEIVAYVKNEAELKHGYISLEYIKKGVPLEEDGWNIEY